VISAKRIMGVAGDQAATILDRFPGYREELVRSLVAIITTQSDGLSDRARREQVGKVIDAFGGKVTAKKGT
jgi:hypothetical protein